MHFNDGFGAQKSVLIHTAIFNANLDPILLPTGTKMLFF